MCMLCIVLILVKGQFISKAIYGLLTSPKKQTDKFVLFAFLLFTANKSNLSVCFLGESMAPQYYMTFTTPLIILVFQSQRLTQL